METTATDNIILSNEEIMNNIDKNSKWKPQNDYYQKNKD
jgi:hypothetical protein